MKGACAAVLAGFQGLGGDDSRERPVDRLAALGVIGREIPDERNGRQIARAAIALQEAHLCSLGVDLIGFKFAHRTTAKKDAEDKLALALAWPQWKLRITSRERDRVAMWTVMEWAVDMCPRCAGASVIPDQAHREGAQPMKPCPECNSTGKRRYSDHERKEALGGVYDKALSVAHGLIGRAEDLAVRGAKTMLERW